MAKNKKNVPKEKKHISKKKRTFKKVKIPEGTHDAEATADVVSVSEEVQETGELVDVFQVEMDKASVSTADEPDEKVHIVENDCDSNGTVLAAMPVENVDSLASKLPSGKRVSATVAGAAKYLKVSADIVGQAFKHELDRHGVDTAQMITTTKQDLHNIAGAFKAGGSAFVQHLSTANRRKETERTD